MASAQDLPSGVEEKEDPLHEHDHDDDDSSIFSWHHSEGPRSLRRSSTSRSAAGEPLERTLSKSLSRPFSRKQTTFYHPLTQEKTAQDVLVHFDGDDDPYRPMNWSLYKKSYHTVIYGLLAMTTSFASAVFSAAIRDVATEFQVGEEVATLGIALLLFGLGIGPLLWAPFSEIYGRKYTVLVPVLISACFSFGTGASKDIQTLLICRFFTGFFGSAPITNTGGVLGDLFPPKSRGLALIGYSIAVVGGPCVGPLIGNAIVISPAGWRWTEYVQGMLQAVLVVVGFLFLEETYPGVLLIYKAKRLRLESGNWSLHAEMEEWDISLDELIHKYLVRPISIIMTPVGGLMIFYASFCYGLIYAALGAFPLIFEGGYDWTPVQASLPFLAELIGVLFGCLINAQNQERYARIMETEGKGKPVPRARLYPMLFGSPLLSAGIFLVAWSSQYRVFWVVPNIGIIMIGTGFFTIFQGALNYLIDTFQSKAASAIAGATFARSMMAGAFPLFLTYQLNAMGFGWGLSVYGFLAVALLPVPYLFFAYDAKIRALSTKNLD